MVITVAGDCAGTNPGSRVDTPGRLAVIAGQNVDFVEIEIDQVRLFAAVRVMAGVAGGGRMVEIAVQVFRAYLEMGGGGRGTGRIGALLVAFETDLAVKGAAQNVQVRRAMWAVPGIMAVGTIDH